MGFGVSLILIAVGLILALAVNTNSSAVDIQPSAGSSRSSVRSASCCR